jgi:hypothetical protein
MQVRRTLIFSLVKTNLIISGFDIHRNDDEGNFNYINHSLQIISNTPSFVLCLILALIVAQLLRFAHNKVVPDSMLTLNRWKSTAVPTRTLSTTLARHGEDWRNKLRIGVPKSTLNGCETNSQSILVKRLLRVKTAFYDCMVPFYETCSLSIGQ